MNIVEAIVKEIENSGIVLQDRQDVYNSIEKAIDKGQFEFIRKDGKNIGFFTWEFDPVTREVYWNNMLVFKPYRGKFNVLSLRKIIYERHGDDVTFVWRNRKRQADMKFKQRGLLCRS